MAPGPTKRQQQRDGITRAERRVLGRAGVDVILTYQSFKLPGVQEKVPSNPSPARRVQFSKKATVDAAAVMAAARASEESSAAAGDVDGNGSYFMPREDADEEDNTESYAKVRKIIFDNAIKYNITKLEQKYVNFTDIVDINDYEALENHVSEDLAARFGEGDLFRLVMLIIIVLNSVMIAIQTDENIAEQYNTYFTLLDYAFLSIFIMEIFFKWFYGFIQFWKNGWNFFDVLLVVLSLLGGQFQIFKDTNVLRILRVLRAFRSLRSISIFNGVQTVVQTIVDSTPDMINIIILLLVLMFIWAVVGVTMFQSYAPKYFADLPTSMFTLFIMITQIGWIESFAELEASGQFLPAALYYVSFMVIGVFIFMKIIVAVVVSNLEETYSNQKKQEIQKYRALKTSLISTQGMKKYQRHVRPMPAGDDPIWKNQIPYEIPDFEKMSKAKLENYFLILSIIEENLKEYSTLKDQIADIQFELKLMNTPLVDEDEEAEVIHEELEEGDALSRWMAKQK